MEKIYDVVGFRATDHFKTEEYFKEFTGVCTFTETTTTGIFFKLIEGINLDQLGVDYSHMEMTCGVENLRLPGEPEHIPIDIPDKLLTKTRLDHFYPINDEARQLNVIRIKETLDSIRTTPECRFGGKRFIKATVNEQSDFAEKQDLVPGCEFIYSVIFYKPCSIHFGQRNSAEKLRFAYEIEVLGSNFLSDMVDIIECISNSAVIREVDSTSVDLTQFKNARKLYPSQTVFIDSVFYNDTRPPDAIDLSPNIIQWAKEKNIGKFTTAVMQETRLSSLTPRLGYPYVYIHQGDCEHIFAFTDARLIQSDDCLLRSKYPKIGSFSRQSNIMCIICTTRESEWLVAKCDRLPQEKTLLCTECCNSYLFIDGKKVTDFKLYPIFEQTVIK